MKNASPDEPASMLTRSFIFLQGIGETAERRLWGCGLTHWRHFLAASGVPAIGPARKALYDRAIQEIWDDVREARWRRVAGRFKPQDQWRLFHALRDGTVFLDIETNGLPAPGLRKSRAKTGEHGVITLVGLYGSRTMTTLIRHHNLTEARLRDVLSHYDLIVTFFGSGFDLPYLRAIYPRLDLTHAHFDLCMAARRLGLRGGLKRLETELGLARPAEVRGLNGWDAVNLWNAWQTGDCAAGRTLCAYNEEDVRNLEPLADFMYRELCKLHDTAYNILPES